jgi:hypothetical protein
MSRHWQCTVTQRAVGLAVERGHYTTQGFVILVGPPGEF